MNHQEEIINRLKTLFELKKYRLLLDFFNQHSNLLEVQEVVLLIAKTHIKLGQIDQSTILLENLIVRDPDYILAKFYLALSTYPIKPQRALQLIQECIQRSPNEYAYWGTLGNIHLHQKDFKQAITAYEKSIQLNPTKTTSIGNLGACYSELKQYEQAIKLFTQAISLNPNYVKGFINLAVTYSRKGQYEIAHSYYLKAMSLEPNSPHAIYGLACVYAQQDKSEEAFKYLKMTFELDPSFKQTVLEDEDFKLLKTHPQFIQMTT